MFQKTRIRLTILNSLVFIILIGVLGSIIYSYTYKRIYSGVNESIEKAVQHRKNADDKNYLKKLGISSNWGSKDNGVNLDGKHGGDRY